MLGIDACTPGGTALRQSAREKTVKSVSLWARVRSGGGQSECRTCTGPRTSAPALDHNPILTPNLNDYLITVAPNAQGSFRAGTHRNAVPDLFFDHRNAVPVLYGI